MADRRNIDRRQSGRRSSDTRRPVRGEAGNQSASGNAESRPPIFDVWSRSGTKYRLRAAVLLVVNVLLFAALGCFAYWLRTGDIFAPAHDGYWRQFAETFHPSANTTVTLSSLLTYPINVHRVPMQIVILGLQLAALVSIPILISILYRFPACLPFVGVVAFLAMMPWLAITLTGACVLASLRPFRFQFRFASALLGLLLVIVYFFAASRQTSVPVAVIENPADRIMFMLPWLLAAVAACAVMAFVLLIAKWVNYRPGAVAPLLALMFLIPIILFEFYVGRDELHYRVLEHDFGPGSDYLADRDVAEEFEYTVQLDWKVRPSPKPQREVSERTVELLWLLQLDAERNRYEVKRRVDWFCKHFPDSRYAVNALYLKGRALDMRVDQQAFRTDARAVRFYSSFPSESSRSTWLMVADNAPRSPMAAVALHRLAILDARSGDIASALRRLDSLFAQYGEAATTTQASPQTEAQGLGRGPVESSLGITLDHTLLEGRRLKSLLIENNDPLYGYLPIEEFLHFDPKNEQYPDNLRRLIEKYPSAQLTDNAELEIALATPDVAESIALLESCVRRRPHGDALPETLYRLGQAYQQSKRPDQARIWYSRILAERPDSFWRRLAEERLRVLPPEASTTTPDP